jgi:hypothetical protein
MAQLGGNKNTSGVLYKRKQPGKQFMENAIPFPLRKRI